MGSAIQSQTVRRLRRPGLEPGSLDHRFDRSSSHSAFSPRHHARGVHRPRPGTHHVRHRDPCLLGNLVAQSRPKPRGGSTAWSSERSSATIARNASAIALSCWLSGSASSQPAYSAFKRPRRWCHSTVGSASADRWATCANNRCTSRACGAIACLAFCAGHGLFIDRWTGGGKPHRSSSSPRQCGRSCWPVASLRGLRSSRGP
jgi:hypothetical protein